MSSVRLCSGHARGHVGLDVVEHLIGSRLDDVDRAIAQAHRWYPVVSDLGPVLLIGGPPGGGAGRSHSGDGGFEKLYGFFIAAPPMSPVPT